MTVRKGEPWGERAVAPADLAHAASDAEAADLVRRGNHEFMLTGGDMWRTLGGASHADELLDGAGERTMVPVDCLWVDWVQEGSSRREPVFAHAVIRLGNRRRWFRPGDLCFVMNAQFRGSFDVAPRSHPNDGRFEVVTVKSSMSWRQRWLLRRRLVTGTHLPHPCIHVRAVTDTWRAEQTGTMTLDGVRVGGAEQIQISIRPDSLKVWF